MTTFYGTNFADVLPGAGDNSGNDTLVGFYGNDELTGGLGVDVLDGGGDDDRLYINFQGEVAAGENYRGRSGFDTLVLTAPTAIDISAATINADIERLETSGDVLVTAAQLGAFVSVSVSGSVTLTNAGSANLTAAFVSAFGGINLAAGGNTLNLTEVVSSGFTIIGNAGADTVFGSETNDVIFGGANGDTLIGNGGDDQLTGGAGLDGVNGGLGNDTLIVDSQAELFAGEDYRGGAGSDTLLLTPVAGTVNISSVTINADVETLSSNTSVSLTATQLGLFSVVSVPGSITLTTGGTADLTGASVSAGAFILNSAGNTLILADVAGGFTITGNSGIDTVSGGEFGDSITGAGGNDILLGRGGDDILTGGVGIDGVNGGAGNDRLVVNASGELLAGEDYRGGSGSDVLDLELATTVNLSAIAVNADIEALESNGAVMLTAAQLGSFNSVSTAGAITLTTMGTVGLDGAVVSTPTFNLVGNTLQLRGVTGGVTINGSSNVDTVFATESSDTIIGGAGADILLGQGGADTITGGTGADGVNGGSGNDTLRVTAQADVPAGEVVRGGSDFDTLFVDTVSTINLSDIAINADVEALSANGGISLKPLQLGTFVSLSVAGNVTLTESGSANLVGASGSVGGTYNLHSGGNALNLTDMISAATVNGNAGADTVHGTLSGDTLNGSGGSDFLAGNDGNDTVNGGLGIDTLRGGNGDDRLLINSPSELGAGESYAGGTGFDTFDLETPSAADVSTVAIDADIERLESGGDVSLTATQLGNFSSLSTGSLTLTTAGTADLTAAFMSVGQINLSPLGNTLTLTDVLSASAIVLGGASGDTVHGTEIGDDINGADGNDTLNGRGGDDSLTGGLGIDSVDGGAGNDRLFILDEAEVQFGGTYTGGSGFDTLDLETPYTDLSAATIGGDVEALESNGTIALTAAQLGSFSSISTPGTITLLGAGTADISNASSLFVGGIDLSSAGNTLTMSGITSTSGVWVTGGVGADTISGTEVADTLDGGDGNDTLNGRFGNDLLTGGLGIDTSSGGAGDDRLIVTDQSELGAGEAYNGGNGLDTLHLQTPNPIDLSAVTINGDVERLEADGEVSLNAAQLDLFVEVATAGQINLLTAGVVDLTGAFVTTDIFNLHAGGNTLNLNEVVSDVFTVNGGIGADTIVGGRFGDTLNGGDSDDAIMGGAGNDTMDGGGGTDTFNYDAIAFDSLDMEIGTVDTINNSVGDRINYTPNMEALLKIGGTSLSALTLDTILGATFDAGTNIRFDSGQVQIDIDADQIYTFGIDPTINLAGVDFVTYDVGLDMLLPDAFIMI